MLTRMTDRVAQYLAALERLAPLIAEHRHGFDRDRRLSDTVFKALADAGLFRLWLPEKLGGPGLSPLQFMEIVEAASALDGSVGWLVGVVVVSGTVVVVGAGAPSPESAGGGAGGQTCTRK